VVVVGGRGDPAVKPSPNRSHGPAGGILVTGLQVSTTPARS
jgi:hypothetical protein